MAKGLSSNFPLIGSEVNAIISTPVSTPIAHTTSYVFCQPIIEISNIDKEARPSANFPELAIRELAMILFSIGNISFTMEKANGSITELIPP